jgi:hypothetical protein
MFFFKQKKRFFLVIWISLFLASMACRVEAPRIILKESPTAPPTVVITQIITQVITPTPAPVTPTPPPSPTPAPSPTSTFDPLSVPIYYPLPDCVASRLHKGENAMVSYVGGANGIRYGPDVHEDSVFSYAQPGEILRIIDGPWCSWGYLVWMVETKDGIRGFTPEGDGNTYWLIPAPR